MMDSIRRGDDAARFYFQYKCLNKIVFGAKGSFLYLPQVSVNIILSLGLYAYHNTLIQTTVSCARHR